MISGAAIGKVVANAVAGKGVEIYKNHKREKLLNALEEGDLSVDSNQLQKDEFIASYLATERALERSISVAKVDALTSMFYRGVESQKLFEQYDVYQEVLSIVTDLSERELHLMYHLYQFSEQTNNSSSDSDDLAKQQHEYLADKLGISREMVKAMLVRLRRTGLILSESELNDEYALMFQTGFELMHVSKLAKELKHWIVFSVEI
ncbi:hypothetical protein [Vibrio coralliirubri]|uniref:hypothetical protein n=1 Tax=Vibrio coralliirubri TaxID=1516159 RepID=UPI0006301149|nr:hypothetical protein [Vibrio coralliirubri]CDT91524.1 hypothetical protein VCR29J2_90008 [Vibrio coralliirubri]